MLGFLKLPKLLVSVMHFLLALSDTSFILDIQDTMLVVTVDEEKIRKFIIEKCAMMDKFIQHDSGVTTRTILETMIPDKYLPQGLVDPRRHFSCGSIENDERIDSCNKNDGTIDSCKESDKENDSCNDSYTVASAPLEDYFQPKETTPSGNKIIRTKRGTLTHFFVKK